MNGGQIQMGDGNFSHRSNLNLQTDASAGAQPMKFWDLHYDQDGGAYVPNQICQLKGYLSAYNGIDYNVPNSGTPFTTNFIGYSNSLGDYSLQIAGISSTATNGTIINKSLKYLKATSLYYQPFSYGSLITVAALTQNLLSAGNTGTLNSYYHIKVTFTTSTPTLYIPDPVAALAGCEIKFIRAGTTTSNAVNIATVTNTTATSNFLISPSATDISPTFTLGSNWNKVGFVCLINPDATGTQYAWQQILYQ